MLLFPYCLNLVNFFLLLFLWLATEAQATQATSRPNPHFASPPRPFCVNIEWPMIRVSRRQLPRLPASLLSIRKAVADPPELADA